VKRRIVRVAMARITFVLLPGRRMRKSVKACKNLRYYMLPWIPCPKRRRASSSAVSGSCRIAAKFSPTAGR
jgi:hypothetical protein